MVSLAALPAGGADEHNVSRGRTRSRLRFHLRCRVLDQAKYGVKVNRQSGTPLLVRHFLDGNVLGRPHPVIGDEDVEASEMLDRLPHQSPSRFSTRQVAGNGVAVGLTAFLGESFGLFAGFLIAENDFRAGCGEEANCGGADTAGASGDESYFVGE